MVTEALDQITDAEKRADHAVAAAKQKAAAVLSEARRRAETVKSEAEKKAAEAKSRILSAAEAETRAFEEQKKEESQKVCRALCSDAEKRLDQAVGLAAEKLLSGDA